MNRNGPSGGRDLLGSELITREVPIVFAKHSKIGYKSSFHYCVERLHLSEGSVASRIHVANVRQY